MSRLEHDSKAVENNLQDLESLGWTIVESGDNFSVTCKGKDDEKLTYSVTKNAQTGSLAPKQLKDLRSDHGRRHGHE